MVLAPRRWCQVREGKLSRVTVAKEPEHRGEHGIIRKAIAWGMPGDSGVTCMLVCAFYYILHTRPRAHRPPGIPCALNSERAGINEHLAKKAFGEIAKPCPVISPPSTRPCAWRGGVGGGGCFNKLGARMRARICRATPHPRPLRASFARLDPTASRGREMFAMAGCLKI